MDKHIMRRVAKQFIPNVNKKDTTSASDKQQKSLKQFALDATDEVLRECNKADTFIMWNMQEYIVNFHAWIHEINRILKKDAPSSNMETNSL